LAPDRTLAAEATDRAGRGLTEEEAAHLLQTVGPNELPEQTTPAWLRLAARFWGPLPWMLEVTIALTLVLGKDLEGAIIAALLVVNSLIGFRQSAKADAALAALKSRLAVKARVLRDGSWHTVASRLVVPGDVVKIRAGDLAPADLEIQEGQVSSDQSSLTGESLPQEVGPGDQVYGSSIVARGEATGVVTATGERSYFGRTAQLVQTARGKTALEKAVFSIIRYLVVIDAVLVVAMVVYALVVGASLGDVAPFALIVLIASVPVALPATFSVAQAVGSQELSDDAGVLVTRLQAIQEAASMDVLCTDKTGTLTTNRLELADTAPYGPVDVAELLHLGALASDAAGQDPIDLAVLKAAALGDGDHAEGWERLSFEPFDPSTKRTLAVVEHRGPQGTERLVVVKGMPEIVAASCADAPGQWPADLERLASTGSRVLAVAYGPVPAAGQPASEPLRLAGLVALADPPRPDAAHLVAELRGLGIEVKMVTGDTVPTALAVARKVGIEGPAVTGAQLRANPELARSASILAAVFPEDKFEVVRSLQEAGHTVGMTGDGVNDAPALRRAEVGVAVEGAVDVARGAASLVLTDPGLMDLVAAVGVSRCIHQRMLTWTFNKIVKTLAVALFLTLGFFFTRSLVTTPLDIVLLLFANDFVTMSLAVDRVRPSARPDSWRPAALTVAAAVLAGALVVESFLDLYLARHVFGLGLRQAQTLMFTMLVFTGLGTVYLVRERGRLWASRPGTLLLAVTAADVVLITAMATLGILMVPVALSYVLAVLGIAVGFLLILDPIKVWLLRRLNFD
jgi:H+-transporting ATPase